MTTTTDERKELGDWAAEMMGKRPLANGYGFSIRNIDGWDVFFEESEDLVSWAGMGLLVEAMAAKGWNLHITRHDGGMTWASWQHSTREEPKDGYRHALLQREVKNGDGDVPLAAFQAAREAAEGGE